MPDDISTPSHSTRAAVDGPAKGSDDPRDLAERCLKRAEDLGPSTFALITPSRAIAEATRSASRYAAGQALGNLDGVPLAYKDVFDLAGTTTTAGSASRKCAPPAASDAEAIRLLSAAGAVCIGKTQLSEFAFSGLGLNAHFGTPTNRVSPDRVPGGSSSGSAVAVASGAVACSLGSDTSGSVRVPAAFNSVVGFRPTQRRYPRTGMHPLAESLDTVGTIARTVATVAAVDNVLAPQRPATRTRRWPQIVVATDQSTDQVDDVVAAALDDALIALDRAGLTIHWRRVGCLDAAQRAFDQHGTLVAAEAYRLHYAVLDKDARLHDPNFLLRLRVAATITEADYRALLQRRRELMSTAANELADCLVVMPTVPVVAPRRALVESNYELYSQANALVLRNTMLASFLDMPALALPIPSARCGLATSLSIMAPSGRDHDVLIAARWIETILNAGRRGAFLPA